MINNNSFKINHKVPNSYIISTKKGNDQELIQSNPRFHPKTKREIRTHTNTVKRSRKARTVNRMNSSFPNRWSFSYCCLVIWGSTGCFLLFRYFSGIVSHAGVLRASQYVSVESSSLTHHRPYSWFLYLKLIHWWVWSCGPNVLNHCRSWGRGFEFSKTR